MSQNSSIERAHSGELISITVPEGVNKMKKEKTRISYIKFFVVTLVIALSFVIAMPTVVFASEEGSSQVVDLTATEEETTDTTDTDVIVPPIDVEEPEALATAPAEEEATSDAAAVPAQPRTISLTAAGAAVLIVVIVAVILLFVAIIVVYKRKKTEAEEGSIEDLVDKICKAIEDAEKAIQESEKERDEAIKAANEKFEKTETEWADKIIDLVKSLEAKLKEVLGKLGSYESYQEKIKSWKEKWEPKTTKPNKKRK